MTLTKEYFKTIIVMVTIIICIVLNTEASFASEEKPSRFIAHGGGFVDGFYTTNSVEAIRQSIADGFTLIELDMCFSRDDRIIMLHDWDRTVVHYFGAPFARRPSEREFEQLLVHGRFQTLTFNRLTKILDEAPDIRIITDVKSDNIKVLTMIVEQFPDYVERMIVQIYSYEEYDIVRELGFEDIILTLYAMPEIDYDELIQFIKDSDLFAVAVGTTHDHAFGDREFGSLMQKLVDDGVLVYFHPVGDFETAIDVMERGAHGIFASRVTPADFEEPARLHFLAEDGIRIMDLIVSEKTLCALKDVEIKNSEDKDITYFVNGKVVTDAMIEDLESGRHDLKIVLKRDGVVVIELEYLLWSSDSYLRIFNPRYEHRINMLRDFPVMREVLGNADTVSDEVKDILMNSFVVKVGEHHGYNDGELLVFFANQEFFQTQLHRNGSIMSPFADSVTALGADSILMDQGRFVYVYFEGTRTMFMADTNFFRRGMERSGRMRTPLTIQRNRIMATGELYRIITGRHYIENRELKILLPAGTNVNDVDETEIFEAASLLFEVDFEQTGI